MAYDQSKLAGDALSTLKHWPFTRQGSLAKQLGVNRHTLAASIRAETGKAFSQVREQFLADVIMSLISRNGSHSVKETAFDAGFSSERCFRRFVARRWGVPPTALRGLGESQPTEGQVKGGVPPRGALDLRCDGTIPLLAYVTSATCQIPDIVPAPVRRDWMDRTDRSFAYRCLPLRMANQAGYFLLNPTRVVVMWDGTNTRDGLKIEAGPGQTLAVSHFGQGILTWKVPFIFRTPTGWGLWVRGPSNLCKDGACALDGIVESDWAVATFTMNWKVTRPGKPVTFEAGEPYCMVLPFDCSCLERIRPAICNLTANPELKLEYEAWSASREDFNALPMERRGSGWQKHYYAGTTPRGSRADDHRTGFRLAPFRVKGEV